MHSKLKTFLFRPDINLSGLVRLAGLGVGRSSVAQWIAKDDFPLAKEEIEKLEKYCIANLGYQAETDLYAEVDSLMQNITRTIQIFEAVRDNERELSESEKQMHKRLYLIQDVLASTEMLEKNPRSYIDFEDGGIYRFGISAEYFRSGLFKEINKY
jgi:hypothetical protein